MKFYDQEFEDQVDELDMIWDDLQKLIHELSKENPFYFELLELAHEVYEEEEKTKERMPKDDTNEYLTREYWRNQL